MMASGLRALALAMLLGVAVGCGHNEEEACDALPASTEASADGAVMYWVSVERDAPIRLPPADLITERVLAPASPHGVARRRRRPGCPAPLP